MTGVGELLRRHLDSIAGRMGRHLRGFEDPAVHLGTASSFAREFDKVFRFPALRVPSREGVVTYADAVRRYRYAGIEKAAADDPVMTMARGLRGPQTMAHERRAELPAEPLLEDLGALLRTPLLRFYLQVHETKRFRAELESTARAGRFALAVAARASEAACPACGRRLERDRSGPARCPSCGRTYETVAWLPLGSGIAASVSYEFLRRLVALESVAAYQEESRIVHAHNSKEEKP